MTGAVVIGAPIPRVDAAAKTNGRAAYTGDLRLPGMVYARLLRSPYAHARVRGVRTQAALTLPGVVAVLTRDNAPAVRYNSSPFDAVPGSRARIVDETLFDDVVRHVGDPVAIVVATDWESAEEALEQIEVDYEVLPPVLDPEAALAPDSPRVHDGRPDNVVAHAELVHGDVGAGFSSSDIVIERQYRTSRQKHAQLEHQVCAADWSGDRLTVWTPTQSPHQVRTKLAALWRLPQSGVRVIAVNVGGGFGHRVGFVLEPYATAVAMRLRRPVMLRLNRLEDFTNSESRHPVIVTVKAGGRRDGTLTALEVTSLLDAGAYAGSSGEVVHVHGQLGMRLYRCARRFMGTAVYTNTPGCGSFRGVGGPQASFSIEQCLDELAGALDWDPIEFRLRNSLRLGDADPWTHLPIQSWALDEVLRRGRAAIDWDALRARRLRDGPWRRGVGMAPVMHVSGGNCISPKRVEGSAVLVRVTPDGGAEVFCGQSETGTGVTTMVSQIVAAELSLPIERVSITIGDTSGTPYDSGSHASRTAFTTGWAARRAAEDARRQLLQVAADMLEARADDLEFASGRIRVKGTPGRSVGVHEVAQRAYHTVTEILGKGVAPISNAPPVGAHFADVSVHEETGAIRINRYVAVHDVGRALNRSVVEGQIHGAIAQGIGFALSEEVRIDPEGGAVTNASLMDYKVLTAADLPPFEVILVEHLDPNGPYGAKGVGEVGIVPVAGALANAVADAIGTRVLHAPMTPARVLAALDEVT